MVAVMSRRARNTSMNTSVSSCVSRQYYEHHKVPSSRTEEAHVVLAEAQNIHSESFAPLTLAFRIFFRGICRRIR
jgi:hypothetical protein